MSESGSAREVLRALVFPGVLLGGMGITGVLYASGVGDLLPVAAGTLFASLALLGFQRLLPFEETWKGRPGDFGIDLLHMVSTSAAGELWRALVFGLAVKASVALAGLAGGSLWPTYLPWVAQLALALVVGDLGAYWLHRTCHTSPLLWRIHAMHHSTERMYVFAASRSHPLNFILAWGAAAVPLLVLGAPDSVLVMVGAFTAIHGMLQHANVDMAHGPLNLVFATADLHRWHHSASFEESNSNYGSNLIFWDLVFGTRYLPDDRRAPARLGIEGLAMPESWLWHLASPVLLDRWTLAEVEELDDFTLEAALASAAGEQPGQAERPAL
ncbi:MAG: sterol desaturase family protein [Myxococcales bacterium]|nr:sterol desaturase family protein [Myxococcales bacterium]MCB9693960.1 sterol desaturase family protein [Alphaproteobacteria bacterium]